MNRLPYNTPQTLFGFKVIVSPDRPKMVLSEELIPGVVPWPPGFKAEMDAWMLMFFGTTNIIPDNQVYQVGHDQFHMNPRTYAAMKAATREDQTKAKWLW